MSTLSAPALYYRLRDSAPRVSTVLATVRSRDRAPVTGPVGDRRRALDATSLRGPGATGTDGRVQALADPTTGRLLAVEGTDRFQGERFARVPLPSGDWVLADRGYAPARGILAAVRAQADVVVRINPATIRLSDAGGHRAPTAALAAQGPAVGPVEFARWRPDPPAPTASRQSGSRPVARARVTIFSGGSPQPRRSRRHPARPRVISVAVAD